MALAHWWLIDVHVMCCGGVANMPTCPTNVAAQVVLTTYTKESVNQRSLCSSCFGKTLVLLASMGYKIEFVK